MNRGRQAQPPDLEAAIEIAARYLGTRPRTRWEVQRRLRKAGAVPTVIEATLERLANSGFIDDAAFVRWWVEQRDRHAPRGRRMLESELRAHGVGREVIEELREELAAPERPADGAELPADDEERARDALARHLHGRPVPDDAKALQRLGAFLVRRGFAPETARRVLREAGIAGDEDPVDEGVTR